MPCIAMICEKMIFPFAHHDEVFIAYGYLSKVVMV